MSFRFKFLTVNKLDSEKVLDKDKKSAFHEIYRYQAEFDKRHGWYWSIQNEKDFINYLQYLGIALSGEVGEFCNLVKKFVRGYRSTRKMKNDMMERLKEELIDVFIYVIKGASQLFKIDLEKEYFRKMKVNEERFRDYEQ